MYLRSSSGLGQGAGQSCPLDLSTATTDQQRDQRLRAALECELNLRFATPTDPGLLERRRRLRTLFRSVPLALASSLRRDLEEAQTPLARLFWGRLARATSREMLGLLCQGFFKEYELRFDPVADTFSVDNNPTMSTVDKALRKRDVIGLIGDAVNSPGILWRRLLDRVDAALLGAVPTSLPGLTTPLRSPGTRLSDAQLALFGESFPDGAGGIDFQSFQRCFERFANGELRDPSVAGHVGFGEPNGGNFFLFAEFAFLCVESGIRADAWLRALRTFVKTQEIFMHVYRESPPPIPPPVGAPLPSGAEVRDVVPTGAPGPGFNLTNFAPIGGAVTVGRGQSDLQRKLALRAKYDMMDLAGLSAAARDNLIRAIRMR